MSDKPDTSSDHDLLIEIKTDLKGLRRDIKNQDTRFNSMQGRVEKLEQWQALEKGKSMSFNSIGAYFMSAVAIFITIVGYLRSVGVI